MLLKGKCKFCGKETTVIQSIEICLDCIAEWRERPETSMETRRLLKSILNVQYAEMISSTSLKTMSQKTKFPDMIGYHADHHPATVQYLFSEARVTRKTHRQGVETGQPSGTIFIDDGVDDVEKERKDKKKRENNDAESEL